MDAEIIAVRDYSPETDKNFVYSTWLRGCYYGSDFYGSIHKDTFFKEYGKFLDQLLARPGTELKVACLLSDPDTILGYACYKGSTLHWVYVKEVFRKKGIATQLIPANISTITHITPVGLNLAKKKQMEFNPWSV